MNIEEIKIMLSNGETIISAEKGDAICKDLGIDKTITIQGEDSFNTKKLLEAIIISKIDKIIAL